MKPSKLYLAVSALASSIALTACSGDSEGIPVNQLPTAVVSAVQTTLPGFAIDEAERHVEDDGVVYELDGNTLDGRRYELEVSETGVIRDIELEE